MTTDYKDGMKSPTLGNAGQSTKSNPLLAKVTTVLSSSFADSNVRDALRTLDERAIRNSADLRRDLRIDVQKEVMICNSDIINDFGQVAQVSGMQQKTTSDNL